MPSKREQVIQAVVEVVRTALPSAAHYRNEVKQRPIPPGGYVNVDDGDPGDPEVSLSPAIWLYEHEIPIEIAANKSKTETAEVRLDAMLQALGAAVELDRSLGGLCDYVMVSAATTEPLTAEGAPVSRSAFINVTAVYGTADPLN